VSRPDDPAVRIALTGRPELLTEEIHALTIDDVRPATLRDGEYTGTENVVPVTASVRVAVRDGKVTAIQLLSHSHGPGHGADAILDRVIAAQSLDMDAVSGSTCSSKAVRTAIELALKRGLLSGRRGSRLLLGLVEARHPTEAEPVREIPERRAPELLFEGVADFAAG